MIVLVILLITFLVALWLFWEQVIIQTLRLTLQVFLTGPIYLIV